MLLENVFRQIEGEIDGVRFVEYNKTPGKFGLRYFPGKKVIFTYNSYKKGWLDTNPIVGKTLKDLLDFSPTCNKPAKYWAVQIPNQEAAKKFDFHLASVLQAIRDYINL